MKMTKLVRTVADLLFPFCVMYGLYIVSHGHLTPGGGFQGGAVIATGTALLIVAHRYDEVSKRVKKNSMKNFEAIGLMAFLLLALSALVLGRPVFQNWLAESGGLFGAQVAFGANPGNLNTGGLMPFMNIAVGLEVLGALSVILLYMLPGAKGESE